MLFFLESRGFDLDQNQVDLARSIGLDARHGDLSTELGSARGVDLISAIWSNSVIALAWKGAASA